ncbi:MAG: sodium:proton antiporter, partial [Candidatus Deferrimicrobium sp.]
MPPPDPIALGLSLPLWSVVPFAGLLLSIALFPLFAPSLWARHYAKVCLAFGVPVAAFFLLRAPRELLHTALEYASFLILLASLFTISGGILLRGTLRGSAGVNC